MIGSPILRTKRERVGAPARLGRGARGKSTAGVEGRECDLPLLFAICGTDASPARCDFSTAVIQNP